MGYLLAFCGGGIVAVIALPVLIPVGMWLLLLFGFVDLTGEPMEPAWITRIKEMLHATKQK